MSGEAIVELRGITKQFPGVLANDSINLKIRRGEIHAIVGENGAGKSTLMKIIAGLYQPDSGEIRIGGRKVNITSPGHAISLGIGMVHQHFTLIPRFTVIENIILGLEPARLGVINWKSAYRELTELCKRYEFNLDLKAQVADLSVGQQQRIEILKVLYRRADILVFDEPTAVLAPQEVSELFRNLRNLKQQGKTVIFISHKLDEVLELADRITVLRRGRVIGTLDAKEATKPKLAEMMVGRPVVFRVPREESKPGQVLLELRDVTVSRAGKKILDHISLSLRGGELYGLAGIEGNGQKELVEAIMGLCPVESGTILVDGRDITQKSVAERRRLGIAYIPEDRHRRGLVLPLKLWENLILGRHEKEEMQKSHILKERHIHEYSRSLIKEYDIRVTGEDQVVATMSGGNQQKAILAREFDVKPRLIIASQPTRGLDVAAIEFVHKQLLKARSQGNAVLVVSADLEEILSLSDRIGVIYNGQIVAELDRSEATPQLLGEYMTGSRKKGGMTA